MSPRCSRLAGSSHSTSPWIRLIATAEHHNTKKKNIMCLHTNLEGTMDPRNGKWAPSTHFTESETLWTQKLSRNKTPKYTKHKGFRLHEHHVANAYIVQTQIFPFVYMCLRGNEIKIILITILCSRFKSAYTACPVPLVSPPTTAYFS